MQWDVFCRVVDNFGDIGVCWRLCSDLAGRGHSVRLWVDDASALSWMAPAARAHVDVRTWSEADLLDAGGDDKNLEPGEVVIEAFGCNPPDAFVARMQRPRPPVWINLEYLSAEAWVDRTHGLRSPVFSGPGAGLTKWFFYPGFSQATGGLLREPGLLESCQAFAAAPSTRADWLEKLGVPTLRPNERLWSLFCYDHAPVSALLDAAQADPAPKRVLVTPGPASRLARAWAPRQRGASLTLTYLPSLSQTDFDRLLWACDVNFVRGEDSAVRALWAGRPHVWNIYHQDDGVHADKLEAFMDRWMGDWPQDLARRIRTLWRTWNGVPGGDAALWPEHARLLTQPGDWTRLSEVSRANLAEFPDLTTQLCGFVASTR